MRVYLLKWYQYLTLILFFFIIYFYVIVQKYFVNTTLFRSIGVALFSIFLITIYFFIIKPEKSYKLALHLGVVITTLTVIAIIIKHVIIDFNIGWRHSILILIAIIAPFICALIYNLFRIKKTKRR